MNDTNVYSLDTYTPHDKKLRSDISGIINMVISSADPRKVVYKYFSFQSGTIKAGDQLIDRDNYEKIYLIAIGKADRRSCSPPSARC